MRARFPSLGAVFFLVWVIWVEGSSLRCFPKILSRIATYLVEVLVSEFEKGNKYMYLCYMTALGQAS